MTLVLVLTILLTGAVSFLCSLSEAVLLSLNPLSLQLQRKRGAADAAAWLEMKQQIERPISAILVFNTFANTGLATLCGALFARQFGVPWLWGFTILFSLAIIFAGELAPKIIGVHHTDRIAPHLISPLKWMIRVMHPLLVVMERFCRLFKPKGPAPGAASVRIMDIITLVEAARAEQVLHNREEIIIIHAATLSTRRVRSAMVPAESIAIFDLRLSLEDNVQALGPKLHRSYPVSEDGTAARITGYVRVRELFVQNLTGGPPHDAPPDWHHLVRPVLHIDEGATLTQLLALFLDQTEIAVLVDNRQGDISGWITMDDVMKVLMGQRI
jgi:CBS domain containing-hemolysin-like protein